MAEGRRKRFNERALARARERGKGGVVLLRMRPTLFLAVRKEALERGLSIPVFVLAVLTEMYQDPEIFDRPANEIRRTVRG